MLEPTKGQAMTLEQIIIEELVNAHEMSIFYLKLMDTARKNDNTEDVERYRKCWNEWCEREYALEKVLDKWEPKLEHYVISGEYRTDPK